MRCSRFLGDLRSGGLPIVLVVFSTGMVTPLAMADEYSASAFWDTIVFQSTFEPPGDAQPEQTRAGGSRRVHRCQPDESPIQVLSPVGNYGLTQEERPDLFIQLPGTSADQIVLTFQDEMGGDYQRSVIPVDAEDELMRLRLPPGTLPLTVGKNYQWTVSVVCDRFLGPRDPVFTGWVQRTEDISIQADIAEVSDQAKAETLAAAGYWYDLLSLLSELEGSINSHPVQSFWAHYLHQAIDNVANETD